MASSPLIIKHHIPGVNIATVWAWVSASVFRERALPTMGSTLQSNRDWLDPGGSSQFDTHIFKGFDAMEEKTDMMRAIFVPDLSSTKNTPVRTYNDSEESFYWPAVLTDIDVNQFQYDGTTYTWVSAGSAGNQYSYWAISPAIKGAYHGLTGVEVNDYISDTPWDFATYSGTPATPSATGIRKESLHPTRIHWDLAGRSGTTGSIPECLIPAGGVSFPQCVLAGSGNVIATARTFSRTPQSDWEDHIFSDRVTFADGLYFRRTKTAKVPPNAPGES